MINIFRKKNSFLILFPFFIITSFAECFSQYSSGKCSLRVKSIPDSVLILIDEDTVGVTPYSKDSISAKIYNLKLLKSGYFKKNIEAEISGNATYYLDVKLIRKKPIQNLRRIAFGALTIGFGVPAYLLHSTKLHDAYKEQKNAWDAYSKWDLDPSEYKDLYNQYLKKVENTNKIIRRRNLYYSCAGLSCIGFIISIPF